MARFGGKQDLSRAQITGRSSRKYGTARGLRTALGTRPAEYKPVDTPGFVPMLPLGIGEAVRRFIRRGGIV